jgi:FkbM family methyltransferase
MSESIQELPSCAAGKPETSNKLGRIRKAVKYGLVGIMGGPLEHVLFRWRLVTMQIKTLVGRPYAALYEMDKKLEKYLSFREGTFIEAGANDGIAQSNSYFLEKKLGWRGVLIEPVPKYARMCQRSRKARVFNCALGPLEKEGEVLEILSGGLMSLPTLVDDKLLHGRSVAEHAAFGAREFGARAPQVVLTKIRALSSLLDECGIQKIDFFSLDVEGFELEVLKGLDLRRHRPEFILIETEQLDAVVKFLGPRYVLLETLSHHDFLFKNVTI